MALFENSLNNQGNTTNYYISNNNNNKIDDTLNISCVIETAQLIENHTEYVLNLQRGSVNTSAYNSWKVLRRYNDFNELNKYFTKFGITLPLPKKKLIGNMQASFIAERRRLLQEYINLILMNPILASSLPAKRFVDPDNYSQSFHDNAVQNASLCLRTDGNYILGETLVNIGWRLRKQYFKVLPKAVIEKSSIRNFVKHSHRSQSQSKNFVPTEESITGVGSTSGNTELVLEWIENGPDKYVDDKDINSILKSLTGLQHPYIEPIKYATCNDNGTLVVRKFYKQGTLKDQICVSSTPKQPYLGKYGNPKERKTLPLPDIAKYGIQILEALKFLHSKGLPFGHLHSGNIVISDGYIRLLDIENFVLGVPSFYRPFFVQHSKLYTLESIDVYCFGHVLYEMFMGHALQESQVRQITNCPESLKNILELILSKEACKNGLPTIDQLMKHQFFTENCYTKTDSTGENLSNAYLKLAINAKEHIQSAKHRYEQRLKDEQKSIKNQKRLVKVQEFMSLEEERKTKHKAAKSEHKQSRLRQQHSLHKNHSFTLNEKSQSSLDNSHSLSSTATEAAEQNSATDTIDVPRSGGHSVSDVESEIVKPPSNFSPPQSVDNEETGETRNALLESISNFNRRSLRKVNINY